MTEKQEKFCYYILFIAFVALYLVIKYIDRKTVRLQDKIKF